MLAMATTRILPFRAPWMTSSSYCTNSSSSSQCADLRSEFTFPADFRSAWFPGHMAKGLRQMQRVVAETDCVIEVHDARIPFSGRNRNFKSQVFI